MGFRTPDGQKVNVPLGGCDVRSHRKHLAKGSFAYAEVLHQDPRSVAASAHG
jgi:hypothetical protein